MRTFIFNDNAKIEYTSIKIRNFSENLGRNIDSVSYFSIDSALNSHDAQKENSEIIFFDKGSCVFQTRVYFFRVILDEKKRLEMTKFPEL